MIVDLTDTVDLLERAATFVQACVRTVATVDGEPDVASDADALVHDLACELAHEAQRLRVTDPAMAKALASMVQVDCSLEPSEAEAQPFDISARRPTHAATGSRSVRPLLELIDDYIVIVLASCRPGRDANADQLAALSLWNSIRAEACRLANAP